MFGISNIQKNLNSEIEKNINHAQLKQNLDPMSSTEIKAHQSFQNFKNKNLEHFPPSSHESPLRKMINKIQSLFCCCCFKNNKPEEREIKAEKIESEEEEIEKTSSLSKRFFSFFSTRYELMKDAVISGAYGFNSEESGFLAVVKSLFKNCMGYIPIISTIFIAPTRIDPNDSEVASLLEKEQDARKEKKT